MRAALESAHRGWVDRSSSVSQISSGNLHPSIPVGHRSRMERFRVGGVKGRSQLPGIVEDAMKGDMDLEPCHAYHGLDEINDAFDLMHEGKSIRTVIRY
ncbi:hypothetical protein ACNKHM_05490 [Shigella sonnei]